MRKIVKKWADGLGVYFTKEEVKSYGMVEGDVLDLDDMLVCKPKKRKQNDTENNK